MSSDVGPEVAPQVQPALDALKEASLPESTDVQSVSLEIFQDRRVVLSKNVPILSTSLSQSSNSATQIQNSKDAISINFRKSQ